MYKLSFAFFFLSQFCLFGQATFSNEYLNIGVGARAHGMGNAQVATISDVTSGYWNPAGLASLEGPLQLGIMHAEWFAGIAKYDYLAFAKPIGDKNAAFGISLIRLGIDNIPNTFYLVAPDGSIDYDNVTPFSAVDYAVIISYAKKLKEKDRKLKFLNGDLSLGGNAKIIRRIIGKFGAAWGFGFDFGAQLQRGNWNFGLVGKDITYTFNAWSFNYNNDEIEILERTNNVIPENGLEYTAPKVVFGVAYNKKFNSRLNLLMELDIDFTSQGQRNTLISSSILNADPHLGLELGMKLSNKETAKSAIYLRTGFNNLQKQISNTNIDEKVLTFQPNIGLGLRLNSFFLDYTMTDFADVSDVLYSHVFSIKINFNKKNRPPSLPDNRNDDIPIFN